MGAEGKEGDLHAACRERIATLEAAVAALQKLVEELQGRDREQRRTLEAQQRKIETLEGRLNQNSRNSSRPPSTDPPSVPPKPPKAPTGRKPGGQPGHLGCQRELVPAEKVKHVEDVKPPKCGKCGRKLRGKDPNPLRHQVTELVVMTETNEWRLHALECPCGHVTRGELPEGVPRGAAGRRCKRPWRI